MPDMPDRKPQDGRASQQIRDTVEAIYRAESRRVLATLIRLLGDFDLAEEALHEAFTSAIERWPADGLPDNPRAWLVSAGRFKAIDGMRRRARFDASLTELAARLEAAAQDAESAARERAEAAAGLGRGGGAPAPDAPTDADLEDDRLRLIFTCCHPALAIDAQIALTLREVCGLTTEEIAHAFLTQPSTLAQRIVRAKAKIRDARIPYEVPTRAELDVRLDAVLHVIYLVFNEGYSASSGAAITRHDLSAEAIRLGRLLVELLRPRQSESHSNADANANDNAEADAASDAEAMGLLALMLLHESRRAARTSPDGELILLDEQDRSIWDRALIAEGIALVQRALGTRRFGPYTLQAAIAAVHAEAARAADTDWVQIVGLYDVLQKADPSPVVALNRAAAVAMRDGPAAGLALIDAILARGELVDYPFAHSARADLYRRLGRRTEAAAAYRTALALLKQEPERRFIMRRLRELD
jgi:RNA polymerase sigma-70 factor (ECF subfamily)